MSNTFIFDDKVKNLYYNTFSFILPGPDDSLRCFGKGREETKFE